jgi:coenzyme F420-0:L-glutamate ligase/coenzyme F420-1:gamma-L-glutamate ligase
MSELQVLAVNGLPEIEAGTNLGELIATRIKPRDGDVVVIAQKAVSKAEGRIRFLSSVTPGPEAHRLATALDKDPALVELILDESSEVLRAERGVLITETKHGFVCANAGIDSSNLPEAGTVCLLPEDPDASARQIREEISGWVSPDKSGECPERPTPGFPPPSEWLSPTVSVAPGASVRAR